jgi:hypothetical protein
MAIIHNKKDSYGLYGFCCAPRAGLTVALGLTLVGGGSAGLVHSPPHQEIPHVEPAQHAPLDIGRFAIVSTVTSALPREFGSPISFTLSGQPTIYISPRWTK